MEKFHGAVGIFGGGQLARMLIEAGKKLNLDMRVLVEAPDSPAAQVCDRVCVGHSDDPAALRKFLAPLSHVVFENEFVDCRILAEAARGLPVRFLPSLETIAELQDKLGQKKLLQREGIETPSFEVLSDERVKRGFPKGAVLKWSRLGYDGKGVFFLRDEPGEAERATEFCRRAWDRGIPVFAEARVSFRRELAMIACRSISGEMVFYPLVVSEQARGICSRVLGPATSLGVAPELEKRAETFCRKIAEAAKLVGVFGVEFFETDSGTLSVNEIAPRVHNTGHYTLDASETSQFENHWRGALGLPLGSTRSSVAFAMVNLLGPEGISLSGSGPSLFQPSAALHLHWYGKKDIRPGRKLGHVNAVATSTGKLSDLIEALDQYRRAWESSLKRTS